MANAVKVVIKIDPTCQCNEGFLQRFKKGQKGEEDQPEIRAPMVHNCQYIRDRQSLHPEASRLVMKTHGLHFFDALDQLYRERFGGK